MKTSLKSFQNTTVEWMLNQEKQYGGGLLFNEAGTGKTICCLDVIIKTLDKYPKTLILCPAGLVSNWENEILKHTDYESKHILKYVGSNRQDDLDQSRASARQDAIFYIASYSIVAREVDDCNKFRKGSLFNDVFSRIVLDEAHYIRNWNRKIFKSVLQIESELKWVVTATPIFNKVDDLYSYFRFLELESVDSRREWQSLTHSASGIVTYRHINDIVKKHSLKMEKSNVLKEELKPKHEFNVEVLLNDFERNFYETLWEYSMQRMKALSERLKRLSGLSDLNSKMMRQLVTNNILVYILRLKQSCNNPWLVISKMKRLQNIKSLQRATARLDFYNSSLNMEEECPICYDNVADSIANPCGHKCCSGCWDKIMRFGLRKCPKCRTEVDSIDNVEIVLANEPEGESTVELENELKCSSKIKSLLEIIRHAFSRGEKIVVVSQWVKMLDIVKEIVSENFKDIRTVSLQGDVSMKARQKSISDFQGQMDIKICYISLMSSAEGINLTAANNLVLLDTWWNQSKMIQVSDRVHRIGQTRNVNIYKLSVGGENSIEKRIEALVSKKEKLKNLIMKNWSISNVESYDDNWIRTPIKLIG
jgi:SNF2 family DNA or RNA helicase